MFKKLLLFSVVFLLVFSISIEPVQAGWFEDAINWLMNVLGFSQEKAEKILEETIYTYDTKTYDTGRTNENGKIYATEVSDSAWGHEDGEWKPIEELRSLKGTSKYECKVESDGINLVECIDWNYSKEDKKFNVKLKLQRDSVSLTDVPLRKYENNQTDGKRIYDDKFEQALSFVSDKEQKARVLKITERT